MNEPHHYHRLHSIYLDSRAFMLSSEFSSFDVFDGLHSPITNALSFGSQFLRRAWIQLVKRASINIRPVLGIRKSANIKALADYVTAEICRARTGHGSYPLDASQLNGAVERIKRERCGGYSGASWGLPFPYATRSGWMPQGSPNIIMTTYCANALLDFYEWSNDDESLSIARSAADFIHQDLGYTEFPDDTICFNYIPNQAYSVHNANMLGAASLSRVYSHTGEAPLSALVRRAAQYTVNRQHDDGGWFYGEKPNLHWIDGFHTGYVLDALHVISKNLRTEEFKPALSAGLDFLIAHFILENGAVKYFHNMLYPLDAQNIAQVLQSLSLLAEHDDRALHRAHRVAEFVSTRMWSGHGYFFPRRSRFVKTRTPFIRWADSPMLVAIACYLAAVDSHVGLLND